MIYGPQQYSLIYTTRDFLTPKCNIFKPDLAPVYVQVTFHPGVEVDFRSRQGMSGSMFEILGTGSTQECFFDDLIDGFPANKIVLGSNIYVLRPNPISE